MLDSSIVLHRHPEGSQVINPRGQVFLSAATPALLRIAANDRVLLVATLRRGLLIVHPSAVAGALFAQFYDSLPEDPRTC